MDGIYIADGDYIKDIEVNDLRNRYILTKGSTQKMVNTPVVSADIPRHLVQGLLGLRPPTSTSVFLSPMLSL